MIAEQISHYRIINRLGAGGMGEVWRARDARLDREVAIKVLPADFAKDADRLRRFEQEARATSALNHPNILTVHDIGTYDGTPYIVAELLDGEELRAELDHGALAQRKAVDYARQIADGLAAAHARGVVHRDLKPENLFVTTNGRVKILDFGLAKLRPSQLGGVNADAPTQRKMTDPGTVMGTVGYMAPEQVRGQEADTRADIFAFGVILYEMLSGRRPFGGASSVEVMNAILKEEPPELAETNAKISPVMEKIVRRCLEKRPERRFQSASDLGFALEALPTFSEPSGASSESQPGRQATLPVTTERAGRARPSGNARLAWLTAAALLLVTLGVSWAYFKRAPTPDARLMKLSLLPPEKSSFNYVAVSPDGRWLAFTAATGSKVQLWVRALADPEAESLEGTEGATYPFWSPDSRFVGFFAGGKLKKVEVGGGGPPVTLCDAGVSTGGTWSREGVILFSSLGARGIWRVPAGGGAPTIVMQADPTFVLQADQKVEGMNLHEPSFLPDGRHFLYFLNSNVKDVRGVYVGSLDGSVRRRLLGGDSNAIYAPSHAADGSGFLLFRREEALMAQPFDTAALQLSGEAFSVAARVGAVAANVTSYRRQNVSVSDNGVLVFDPLPDRQRAQVRWVDRAGKIINSFDGLDNAHARLAPDDRRFALTRIGPQNSSVDVWLSDVDGGAPVRFTFDPGNDQFPVWSPDGNRIVWSSNRGGAFNLYEKDAGGAGQDAPLPQSADPKFPTDWSRDGQHIIYRQIDPQTKYDIWALPLFGGRKPFALLRTEANEAAAVLSPDGRWLAYCSDESGRYEVYVQSFPAGGSKRQISTGGGIGPHWRGDGKELYYHAPDGKLMAAPVTSGASLAAGAPVALFEFRASGNVIMPYYSASRDGQRFLLSTIVETEANAPLTVVVNWAAEAQPSP